MLSLPQTLTTNTALLNGEAAPSKGFGAETAAADGSPGFADTLRATAPAATPPTSLGDAGGNPLPQQGKALPQTFDLPVTGPIKLPTDVPDGLALAGGEAIALDSSSVIHSFDLPRLLNRYAEKSVLPAAANVSGSTDSAIVQASIPTVSLSAAANEVALPVAALPLPPATLPMEAQGALSQLPATVPVNPTVDMQARNAPLVLTNAATVEGASGRTALPLFVAPQPAFTREGLTQRVAAVAPDLMRPVGTYSGDPSPGRNQQLLPLSQQDAAIANAADRTNVIASPASRAALSLALERGGALLPVARDPVASAVAQQLTTPVVRANSVGQDLQRGAAARPMIAATPQSAAAMTALSDAMQMAQPLPTQQVTAAAVLQPRADGAPAPVLNPLAPPVSEVRIAPTRTAPGSVAVTETVIAPINASATAPAPAPVTAPMTAPVTAPVQAPVTLTANVVATPGAAVTNSEAVTAEPVATTAKADIQPAAPTPTIVSAAAAPALPTVAAPASPAATLPPLNLPVTDSAWGDALSERVVVLAGQKLTSADIRLNPAELGPLRVEIKVDDGNTQIHFTAQHAVTREAIEQALPRLRELLSAEGLNLTGADVSEQGVRRDHSEQSESAGQDAVAQDDIAGEEIDGTVDAAAPARTGDGLVDTFA